MKWVEYLQSFTFVIKNKSGVANRVVDALSRRNYLLTEMKVEVLGFDEMKDLYDVDPIFLRCGESAKNQIKKVT